MDSHHKGPVTRKMFQCHDSSCAVYLDLLGSERRSDRPQWNPLHTDQQGTQSHRQQIWRTWVYIVVWFCLLARPICLCLMMTSSNGSIFWSPVNSPHNGQWRRALMFPLICAWTNGWVNNRDTCDLRCHRAHYDVIVMQHLELVNVTDTEKPCASWSSGIGRIRLPASTATVQQAVPTNSRNRPTWHPSLHTDFIRLGSVTKNRKNELTREQLAVGTDSRSVSTGPSRLFSVLMAGCHVGYSRVRRYCLLYLQTVKYDQCQRLRIETARWERPPVLREMGHCEICHQCAEE